jgi:cytochrome c
MMKAILALIMVAALAAATFMPPSVGRAQTATAGPPTQAVYGGQLYQSKCGGCHSMTANKIGPLHKGVFGRKAATVAGYNYSSALRSSGLVWDAKTLDQWLQGPQKLAKGSRMYLVVSDPAQRAAIIAYLKSDAAR